MTFSRRLQSLLALVVLLAGPLGGLAASGVSAQPRTLVIAAVSTPRGLDGDIQRPGTIEAVVQVYEGLTRYATTRGPDGQPVLDASRVEPHLAESWTVSPDGLVYEFTLRQGVRSFFGNELTSADVVFGWEKSAEQRRGGNFMRTVSQVAKVEAVDLRRVRFTLNQPSRVFLRVLTTYQPAIFDSVEARRHAAPDDPFATRWLDANTAGFGPYHMESNRAGEGAVFVVNPNYFGPRPHFDRVVVREVPSAATRATLLRAGQVQWAEELTLAQIADLRRGGRVQIRSAPGTGGPSARMNPKTPPFDDLRVRQAIRLAVDADAVNQAVFQGLGVPNVSVVPPAMPGHVAAYRPVRDLARARALLAEAGHAGGLDVTLEYSTNFWWEEGFALALRDQLAEAGIRVTPRRITATDFAARGAITRRDLPFFVRENAIFVLDAAYAMSLLATTRGVSNQNGYSNPRFDELVEQALKEADDTRFLALVDEAQRLHAADATWVNTVMPGVFAAMASCIEGWTWHPHNRPRWADLSCAR